MSEAKLSNVSSRDVAAMNSDSPDVPKLLLDPSKAMMLVFILSEITFFAILIISYIYFQARGIQGPNAKKALEFERTLIFSVFLFVSSAWIVLAEKALEKKNRRMTVFWTFLTVLFGAIFIFGQVTEYITLLNDNITMSRNLFGSTFFIMTGFHGLHVTAGLIVLSIFGILAALGDFDSGHSSAFTVASWYWHFVDVVWVVIFTLVYVIPYFSAT